MIHKHRSMTQKVNQVSHTWYKVQRNTKQAVKTTAAPEGHVTPWHEPLRGLCGESLRPVGRVEENGAHAAVEPQSGQETLHLPGVGCTAVSLHLNAVVALHTFPVAPGDEQLSVQRHQAAVLMEHVEKLDLHNVNMRTEAGE